MAVSKLEQVRPVCRRGEVPIRGLQESLSCGHQVWGALVLALPCAEELSGMAGFRVEGLLIGGAALLPSLVGQQQCITAQAFCIAASQGVEFWLPYACI